MVKELFWIKTISTTRALSFKSRDCEIMRRKLANYVQCFPGLCVPFLRELYSLNISQVIQSHSGSSEMTHLNRLCVCINSIVTMAVSRIISETELLAENRYFFIPPAFDVPVTGFTVEILPYRFISVADKRYRMAFCTANSSKCDATAFSYISNSDAK